MKNKMEVFPKDEDLATINPLRIKKEKPATAPSQNNATPDLRSDKATGKNEKSNWKKHILQYIVRTLLFLIPPLVCIWQLEDTFVERYLLTLTYLK